MFYKPTAILAIVALASVATVSAAPQNLEDILAQASGLLTGDLNDILAQASDLIGTQMNDVTSLLNDPAFISSAEAAMSSLGGFLSENPDILSSLADELSLPTISAPSVGDDNSEENTESGSDSETDDGSSVSDHSSDAHSSSSKNTSKGSIDTRSVNDETGPTEDHESSSSGAAGLKPVAGVLAAAGLVVYTALF
ncbi:hypothetical protein GGI15_001595 [Coemansia interrupta]|uniref:Uncharacterized protein n=1 Tax=Coemansia interrupta TaxID=1126814 RepID=A0A9W8LNQ7_9FUNG|nr:hypothetical protein GGI15_001595 [Coemansia interrupta]